MPALAAMLLAGCTSVQASPPIAGRQWRVAALNGEPIDDPQARAVFEPYRMTISFGCNTGRGPYRVDGERLVPDGGQARTEMACMPVTDGGPDIMAREDRGFAVTSRPMQMSWESASHLILQNEAGRIDLRR